jgi:hypothetical protein
MLIAGISGILILIIPVKRLKTLGKIKDKLGSFAQVSGINKIRKISVENNKSN